MPQNLQKILYIIVFTFICNINTALAFEGFIANKGQWNGDFIYKATIKSGLVYLEKTGITWLLYDSDSLDKIQHEHGKHTTLPLHVIKTKFKNCNPNAQVTTISPSNAHYNFYIGSDKDKWKSGLKSYKTVYFTNIYKQIDLEIHYSEVGIKYNFIVKPGGDYNSIALEYSGADDIRVTSEGLQIKTSLGLMEEFPPFVFQEINGKNEKIACVFHLEDSTVSFKLKQVYQRKYKLIIDPILVFSTYSGSKADNFGFTATYDAASNGYAGGTVYDFDFPVTIGAYQFNYAGGINESITAPYSYPSRDCAIHKYSADGSQLLYGTFLGGSHNEQPHSMIVNSQNQLIVFGSTRSKNFPNLQSHLVNPNPNKFDYNIFVSIFNENGTNLLHSSLIGGSDNDGINGDLVTHSISDLPLMNNYADDFRGEVIVDNEDHIYIASSTNSLNFPIVNGANSSYSPPQNGVIIKLSKDLNQILWSSHIGSLGYDAAYGVSLGKENDLYVTGGTTNGIIFSSLSGHRSSMPNNLPDGYILRFNSNSGAIIGGTLIGTAQYDQSYMIKTDVNGFPFAFGQTRGNFPTRGNVYKNENGSQFVVKYSKDLTSQILSSTIGSGGVQPNISPAAFMVDVCGNIYLSGWGGVPNGNTYGFANGVTRDMPITPGNALQTTTDGSDFWIAVFKEDMEDILFASYFGGSSTPSLRAHEHVDGGTSRFDERGVIYQALCAGCGGHSRFPSTPNAWSQSNESSNCNFALFKIDMQMQNKKPVVNDTFFRVTVSERLQFNYFGTDPDIEDVLSLSFSAPYFDTSNHTNKPAILTNPSVDTVWASFNWTPSCTDLTGDTIEIRVKIQDTGCPGTDSAFATIKILVEAPQLTAGPEAICLSFFEENEIKISWNEFNLDPYFKLVQLIRINPDSSMVKLMEIQSGRADSYSDKEPTQINTLNYCYFFVTENICGLTDTLSFTSCNLKELENPIVMSELLSVTVVENKDILVTWAQSFEDDFRSYRVFKSPNTEGPSNWTLVTELFNRSDTTFIDQSVNVAEKSFCYRLQVTDLCGNVSDTSNIGCNIVLKGISARWYFDLDWNAYKTWEGGVQDYTLKRSVDTGELRPIVRLTPPLTYRDSDLDYDWGGYFYQVEANQAQNNSLGFKSTSVSNTIYLIQPPLLHVPNAFSPNGDGKNDIWGFVPVFVKDFSIRVFNRWGEKVFETDNKKQQWDGSFLDTEPFDNVFIWIAVYKGWDNEFHRQKGTVTILR